MSPDPSPITNARSMQSMDRSGNSTWAASPIANAVLSRSWPWIWASISPSCSRTGYRSRAYRAKSCGLAPLCSMRDRTRWLTRPVQSGRRRSRSDRRRSRLARGRGVFTVSSPGAGKRPVHNLKRLGSAAQAIRCKLGGKDYTAGEDYMAGAWDCGSSPPKIKPVISKGIKHAS